MRIYDRAGWRGERKAVVAYLRRLAEYEVEYGTESGVRWLRGLAASIAAGRHRARPARAGRRAEG